ncbi:transglutaminase domain-containing protein [Chitinophaga sp. YR627]|uniref:transglutaminase domain-containing protein n=1 Tax=Chitinophaga sp. YR627 TaxID=1881041 RepID=UPI0011607EFA|nr:transglutaminase domain-containing protein [Chitinophaga sp. YR627]
MRYTITILLLMCMAASVSFGQKADKEQLLQINHLKKTPPYDTTQQQTFPVFTYQSPDDSALVTLREIYHLDSIAGQGSETERAIRLLEWFHNQVPHEDVRSLPVLTARYIIDSYREKKVGQGCYPLSIAMNEIFLSMGFKSRSVICFSGKYPEPNGGHVINAVYMPSLRKWIYMDPQDNAYVKDEKGNFLSVEEVRERLVNGKPMYLNAGANYHQVPTKKEQYLYTFMAEHMYRLICPVNSTYDSQTRSAGKVLQYVELLPAGSKDPAVDMFETSVSRNTNVISYHTNNNRAFWQLPSDR